MSINEIKLTVRNFLVHHTGNSNFTNEDLLFEGGFISSLMAMELVLFIESEFAMKISDEELQLKNFESVAAIANLVSQKRK